MTEPGNAAGGGGVDSGCWSDRWLAARGRVAPQFAERFAAVADMPPLGSRPLTEEENARRDAFDAPFGDAQLPAEGVDVHVVDTETPGPNGPVPVRIYRPATDSPPGGRAGLVWIHGGAWIFGDLDMPEADHVSRRLAHLADAVVVSVDYRLATEGRHHPVPHDDCYAAYTWVRQHTTDLGIDPARLAVGGGSAGGNLAATVALHARDAGIAPWQVLLAYPACHPAFPPPDQELTRRLAMLPAMIRMDGDDDSLTVNYLGGPADSAVPYAFPALAHSLGGFPPTYIENGEFDRIRPSGEAFGEQLAAAGVDVRVVTAAGVPHGHLNAVGLPETLAAHERFAERLRGIGVSGVSGVSG